MHQHTQSGWLSLGMRKIAGFWQIIAKFDFVAENGHLSGYGINFHKELNPAPVVNLCLNGTIRKL